MFKFKFLNFQILKFLVEQTVHRVVDPSIDRSTHDLTITV